MPEFTEEQQKFLDLFQSQVEQGENAQLLDLMHNCTNKFQFAKTYRVYRKDLENTEAQMRARIASGNLGPGITPEVAEEMIRIGREAVENKMKRCAEFFFGRWGEPITNYAGTGTGCVGVLGTLALILMIACTPKPQYSGGGFLGGGGSESSRTARYVAELEAYNRERQAYIIGGGIAVAGLAIGGGIFFSRGRKRKEP